MQDAIAKKMTAELPQADEIFLVDDDPAVRDVLKTIFSRAGYAITSFAEGNSLLASMRTQVPACIILDVNIPGRSGIEILKTLNSLNYSGPVLVISGEGDIPMAVDAMRNGALDFVEKPFRGHELVERVSAAIAAARGNREEASTNMGALHFPGRPPLTAREKQVLEQIALGASNKEAARVLGISPRTVELYRARIMEKFGAKNAADLIRVVMSEGRRPSA